MRGCCVEDPWRQIRLDQIRSDQIGDCATLACDGSCIDAFGYRFVTHVIEVGDTCNGLMRLATGSVDVVRVLLKNKADASKVNEQNQTAAQLMDSSPIISKHPKSDSSPSNPRAQIMQLLKPDSKKAPQNACVIC